MHRSLGKSQIYYPEHILGYGRREDLLLSCREFRLFLDRLIGGGDGGGPCTALSPRLRSGAWSPILDGDLDPGLEGDGLVQLVPGVQAGHVFSGYPAGGIDS